MHRGLRDNGVQQRDGADCILLWCEENVGVIDDGLVDTPLDITPTIGQVSASTLLVLSLSVVFIFLEPALLFFLFRPKPFFFR